MRYCNPLLLKMWATDEQDLTGHCTPMLIAALFTTGRTWKQHKCPSTEEWIQKMCCIYTMEYYSATKRTKLGHL